MKPAMRIIRRLIEGYKILSKTPSPLAPVPVRPMTPMEVKGALELLPHKKEVKKPEGFTIPEIAVGKVGIGELKLEEKKPLPTIIYPLIPLKPKKDETVFAYAKIFWDSKQNKNVYQVIEPELTEKLKGIMGKVKELLEQKLDVDLSKMKKTEASDYLNKQIEDIINYFGFKINFTEKQILRYYIERDFIGLGKIEPLFRDPQIEDISCDGVGIPIFVFHRNPNIGSIVTNVTYTDSDELDSFIIRLSQISGKSISIAQPLLDATLPDGSRLQATLGTDIARRGSNFTIRKFTEEPLTPVHLLNYGTIDTKSLAFLWLAVDFGRSILVSGGTASGKTSLLNVLSLFIRPEKKIVSIEDTAELRLPHPHWVPTVARTSISAEGRIGEVDMFALLRESFRQRPDYIIVGEVRGREAYILFQQIATGHPSLATIHAENIGRLMDRLTTAPISLPPPLIGSLDLIVFLSLARYKDKFVRRVTEILEMIEYDPKTKTPVVNQVFKWDPIDDKIKVMNKSIVLKKISDMTGLSEKELVEELKRRTAVLDWMREKNIIDYRDVHRIISMYYSYPGKVLAAIAGEV
jgi:flagellar protein FlaI